MKTLTNNTDINYRLKSRIYLRFPMLSDFAEHVGVSKSYVTKIIRGQRRLPDDEKARWARELGCFSDDIF
jgi:transcriptional regulator with XRE-family HTH domain